MTLSRVAEYVPNLWESLQPRHRDFEIEVPSLTVEQLWAKINEWRISEIDLLKLDCEGAEYLIISELSALGHMDRIGWIRGEWHSRKDNLMLANFLGQTHAFHIDPNPPHDVGMFVAHRLLWRMKESQNSSIHRNLIKLLKNDRTERSHW